MLCKGSGCQRHQCQKRYLLRTRRQCLQVMRQAIIVTSQACCPHMQGACLHRPGPSLPSGGISKARPPTGVAGGFSICRQCMCAPAPTPSKGAPLPGEHPPAKRVQPIIGIHLVEVEVLNAAIQLVHAVMHLQSAFVHATSLSPTRLRAGQGHTTACCLRASQIHLLSAGRPCQVACSERPYAFLLL